MEIKFLDADGFDRHAQAADLAVVLFTRSEIELGSVGSAVERLMLFSDDEQNVRRFEGRVALMFEGYDADARSLVEIPECVRFFRAVDRQWSYWLHYLMPQPDVLNLAVLLLADVQMMSVEGDRRQFAIKDPAELRSLLGRLFTSMNTLHRNYGLSELVNRQRTETVLASLSEVLG